MPNLTPLEIQKQIFARKLKGFDPDEVRAYLHMVAEEIEILIRDVDRLSRENLMLREDLDDHNQRERILKDTLLSAQKVSEDVKMNARKEAELIVKDAELLSERLVSQAMSRVADLEKTMKEDLYMRMQPGQPSRPAATIPLADLKAQHQSLGPELQAAIDTVQHLLMLDAEQEANELPITSMYRAKSE